MIIVLSPAKTLDFETAPNTLHYTQPDMLEKSEQLIGQLKKISESELSSLMSISDSLAQLNVERYHAWTKPADLSKGKQALLAFMGDVYQGLAADTFSEEEMLFAQEHLRILSGLYGLLRPLDIIRPYRLEMGTKLSINGHKDLYSFWGDDISRAVNKALSAHKSKVLLNLASKEYFKSVQNKALSVPIITPTFKENKQGQYKTIGIYAKKARGLMAAYVIKNRISDPEAIKGFQDEGYSYKEEMSSESEWVFAR